MSRRTIGILDVVGGVLLLAAGLWTGYQGGVAADELGTSGRVTPAELACVVLGAGFTCVGAVAWLSGPSRRRAGVTSEGVNAVR